MELDNTFNTTTGPEGSNKTVTIPEDLGQYRIKTTPTMLYNDINWEELEVDEDTPISVLLLFINSLNKRLCELEKQNNLQKNFFKVVPPQEEKDEH